MLAVVVSCAMAGCGGGKGGSLMVDTKTPTKEDPNALLVPYIAPDVNEIAGIEEPDDAADLEDPAPAPAPAAVPEPTPPAAKAAPAAKPAAKPEPKKPEPKK